MTLDDVQLLAWDVAAMTAPKKLTTSEREAAKTSAIFKHWLANKELGPRMTPELKLNDGTVAVVTMSGRILHWLGSGDDVEVV